MHHNHLKNTPEKKTNQNTSPPKRDSFKKKKTSTINTVSTTAHRHYSPPKNTLKIKLPDPDTQAESQFEEHLTEGSCNYHNLAISDPLKEHKTKAQK